MLSRRRELFLAGTLLAGLCLTSLPLNAQEQYDFETPVRLTADGEIIDTGKHIAHSGPAFADINGDGVTDLLVGNFRGTIEYFENTGSAEAPEYAAGKMLEAEGETIKIHNW